MRHKLCPFCSIQKDLCSIQTFQFLFRKHFVNKYRVRTFNIWLIIIFRIWEALEFKLIPNLNFIEWIKISPRKKRSEIIEWSRIPPQRDILTKSLLFTPQKHQLQTGGDKLGKFTLMCQKISTGGDGCFRCTVTCHNWLDVLQLDLLFIFKLNHEKAHRRLYCNFYHCNFDPSLSTKSCREEENWKEKIVAWIWTPQTT